MSKEKDAKALELLGWPTKLINQLIKNPNERAAVLKKITKDGPPHKQLQHTLVLNRLSKLSELLKKRNGVTLKPVAGKDIKTEEHEELLPVQMPTSSLEKILNDDKALEKLIKGPQHEILYTALLLQTIEGMISAEEAAAI